MGNGYIDTRYEARLKRDLAVLKTLAHLGCTTFQHLHALCFPGCVAATARGALAHLCAADAITHTRWMLRHTNQQRGQIWALTTKGFDLLRRYEALPPTMLDIDLGRPSTAVEHDEWRVRMDVRTLIVALIVQARRAAFLTQLRMTLPHTWPTAFGRECRPDAVLHIVWQAPSMKHSDWLPWPEAMSVRAQPIHYPIYLDRTAATSPVCWVQHAAGAVPVDYPCVAVVVLNSEERYIQAQQELTALRYHEPVRLNTWQALAAGVASTPWRDIQGRVCSLQPT